MKHFEDIKDDEIRIISRQEVRKTPLYKRWWFWALIVFAILLMVVVALILRHGVETTKAPVPVTEVVAMSAPREEAGPASVILRDTSINDVPLRILTPVNAWPELMIGLPDSKDTSLMLVTQAADIRADNNKIVGAFVLEGEPISWGKSKKGFCAIVEDQVYIGMAENTPLFEEATEKAGYFFRQYALVNNGQMVESNLKKKALRRALCESEGQIFVVSSMAKESMHDFSQALVDLGVSNAIYLVGGDSYGFCRQPDSLMQWGSTEWTTDGEFVNFIVWRSLIEN